MTSLLVHNDFYSLQATNRRHAPWLEMAAAVFGFISSFVDAHIWSPGSTYYCVLALVFLDFLSGLMVGLRNPIGLETRKLKKLPMSLVCYTGVMLLANKFSAEPALFWMPQTVLAPIVVINFLSFVKNCSLLGWLPETVSRWLYKNIDKYKNTNYETHPHETDPRVEHPTEAEHHLVAN